MSYLDFRQPPKTMGEKHELSTRFPQKGKMTSELLQVLPQKSAENHPLSPCYPPHLQDLKIRKLSTLGILGISGLWAETYRETTLADNVDNSCF